MKKIMAISILIATLSVGRSSAQSTDDRVAYVPRKAPARTADDLRINFLEPVVPGEIELGLPEGTYRLDLLNARGKVKQTRSIGELETINVKKLSRGTWTVRAHTPAGMVVRRFFVMGRGTVLMELPQSRNKR